MAWNLDQPQQPLASGATAPSARGVGTYGQLVGASAEGTSIGYLDGVSGDTNASGGTGTQGTADEGSVMPSMERTIAPRISQRCIWRLTRVHLLHISLCRRIVSITAAASPST